MFVISLLLILLGCESANVTPSMGTIEGTVTIGPLCGNVTAESESSNPCGFANEQLDTIYSKYKVEIKDASSGKSFAKPETLNQTGLFSFQVPVGSHNVGVTLSEGSMAQNTLMGEFTSLKKGVTVTKGR
jgi:hypothetical protein